MESNLIKLESFDILQLLGGDVTMLSLKNEGSIPKYPTTLVAWSKGKVHFNNKP